MTARYLALTILDLAWIGMAMLSGLGVGWALLGHALLTGLTYHAWLRSDPRPPSLLTTSAPSNGEVRADKARRSLPTPGRFGHPQLLIGRDIRRS